MNCRNLFEPPPATSGDEVFDELLRGGEFKLERIVSTGQTTRPGQWYDQSVNEWFVLLSGGATIVFEDEAAPVRLSPGDWIHIPSHKRHRVEWTDPDRQTVWLALHYS
jgi:cupin 2 domain-containing protein